MKQGGHLGLGVEEGSRLARPPAELICRRRPVRQGGWGQVSRTSRWSRRRAGGGARTRGGACDRYAKRARAWRWVERTLDALGGQSTYGNRGVPWTYRRPNCYMDRLQKLVWRRPRSVWDSGHIIRHGELADVGTKGIPPGKAERTLRPQTASVLGRGDRRLGCPLSWLATY